MIGRTCGCSLASVGLILAHVGQMLSHVGICWANVETILVVGVLAVVAWHASSHISRYCNGVLHLRAQTQYTISNNPAHFSCPYRRSLHKERAAGVACDKVNKCKSYPKLTGFTVMFCWCLLDLDSFSSLRNS